MTPGFEPGLEHEVMTGPLCAFGWHQCGLACL